MGFTHLHVHTGYSLLDGLAQIKPLVQRAKELGMDALAITDHGVMYGVVEFWTACKEAGIKPIIGCEVYVAPGSRSDKAGSVSDERYRHLILLAENDIGYHNLIKIVSIGFTEGFYYKPRVDMEVLEKYHEGIICSSACLAGEVAHYLKMDMYEEGKEAALRLERIFGKGNFFLELQDHGIPEQKKVNAYLMRMHEETGIDLICTNDSHYIRAEDAVPHDVLLCIQTQKKVKDEDRMRYEGGQFYLKSEEEMAALFPYAPEALENTCKIAERCNVEFEFGHYKLPKFDVPEGYDAWTYLQHLCDEGIKKRYKEVTPELRERLEYELKIVHDMGFVDYFLIVWDFIKYAKDHDIPVGPGRGSGAGSIAAYCLEITDIDPIKYNLLFERFLNPERVSMPDFDVDFCYERRQEVIDYVVRKYGRDRVCQIVTFGTLAAKNAIRDVGRALDLPYAKIDMVAKLVPNELNITISDALVKSGDLKKLYADDPEVTELIDLAKAVEGLPRHTSIHAAGVIISNAPVDDYVPLSCGADGSVTTQFNMTECEHLGLLKMDFLGLRTLTVIKDAENFVNMSKKPGEKRFSIKDIDYEDKNVYEMISQAKTDGVFQLESKGMTGFMKELKPNSIEDVIAGISLYRPGPMDFIPRYIKGKNDKDSITYECEELKPILETTYGCIVYQEQVMQIVRDLAGYSYGRSDLVRRAMAKKKADVMAKERENFVHGNKEENVPGCENRGISAEVANHIYDEMTDFAKYAFNKAHAACYAVVSYQTAFLKYYYPVEYMAALMTSIMGNTGKVTEYMYTCKKMGVSVLPPDVNESGVGFTVRGRSIRYGLSAIKGVGRQVVEDIKAERENGGNFTSLKDFVKRCIPLGVNKRTVENLIKAGAFDSVPGTRKQLLQVYQIIIDDAVAEHKTEITGQLSLLDFLAPEEKQAMETPLPDVGEFSKDELLAYEKEVLDLYVSGHPLEKYIDIMKKHCDVTTADLKTDEETGETKVSDGQNVIIGGMISGVTRKVTKNNQTMAFLKLDDLYGNVEVIVFPRDFEKNKALLINDEKVLIKGRISIDEERGAKVIASDIGRLDEIPGKLWVRFKNINEFNDKEKELMETLKASDGRSDVVIYLEEEKQMKKLSRGYSVDLTGDLVDRLQEKFGKEQIKVTF
ncbi:MAG: DNA polymerase III subunit alpha [Lachnospiraceae bacterium]|nr:DNA polymerase III subunit alpha [Lachnospiraceae bacterium]